MSHHLPSGHLPITWWNLANAAFWLDQVVLWLNQDDHAEHFAHDLYGCTDPDLHGIIAEAAAGLRATLNTEVGPNQTVTPGPNELDTRTGPAGR